jgi:hypothetical protein
LERGAYIDHRFHDYKTAVAGQREIAMGGGTSNTQKQEQAVSQQQLDISNKLLEQYQQQYQQEQSLQAPLVNFATQVTSGDPKALLSAASPMLSQITKGYNASKEQIQDTMPTGAAKDYALSQLPLQKNQSISDLLNQTYTQAFGTLANLGSQAGGQALSAAGGATTGTANAATTLSNIGQQQAQGKSSTLGFLGQLAGAASYGLAGAFSDRRVKENIKPLDDVLVRLGNFEAVQFDYISGPTDQVGVIAQDLLDQFPELVEKDWNGLYKVNYGGMAAVALHAVRELKEMIQAQAVRITELEEQLHVSAAA